MSDMSLSPPAHRRRSTASIFATKPTAFTRWLRVALVWQMVRFVVINLKMLRIIARSHH
jgi:hypothetical protein